jgi:hypothetical protein
MRYNRAESLPSKIRRSVLLERLLERLPERGVPQVC